MNSVTSTVDSMAGDRSGAAPAGGDKLKVWDWPTRIFHWTLAASFAGAWLSAESERWRDLHVVLGYTMAGLIAFRVAWGVVGSRYARFSSFVFPPSRLLGYLKSLLGRTPEHHAGHNPAGGLVIIAMLLLGAAVVASGYANYREIGGAGGAAAGEWLEELHEGAAEIMLGLVLIHLAGVVVSSFIHRENLPRAMLTGWKAGRPEDGIKRSYPLLGMLLLVAVLGFWGFSQSAPGRAWLAGSPAVEPIGAQESGLAGGVVKNSAKNSVKKSATTPTKKSAEQGRQHERDDD